MLLSFMLSMFNSHNNFMHIIIRETIQLNNKNEHQSIKWYCLLFSVLARVRRIIIIQASETPPEHRRPLPSPTSEWREASRFPASPLWKFSFFSGPFLSVRHSPHHLLAFLQLDPNCERIFCSAQSAQSLQNYGIETTSTRS